MKLPFPDRIHPEHVRRAKMDEYARLQIFKLKVVLFLGALLLWKYL